jgi:chromosome segregation ATPase
MKRTLIAIALFAVLPQAIAQTASLESRMRDQLRETRTQLQELQAQQSQWAVEKAALEKERDDAKKEAETARAAKASSAVSPEASRALAAERQRREAAEASLQRGKADMDSSAVALRTAEAERARLAKELEGSGGCLHRAQRTDVPRGPGSDRGLREHRPG